MRTIKKTVNVTTARVFKPDFETCTFEEVAVRTYLGGRGERLVKSEIKREFGNDCMVDIENRKAVFAMDADTFFKYATECNCDVDSEDIPQP